MNSRKGFRTGFTLMELLVVIAIIAILAAILFPVFASAREKARQTTCASNEKQLGLAMLQYIQDYDESTPYWDHSVGTDRGGWAGKLYSYVKATAVYTCPDDIATAPAGSYEISYACNDWSLSNSLSTKTISKFNAPSSTVAVFEVTGCVISDLTNPNEIDSWVGDGGNGGNTGKTDSGMRWPNTAADNYDTGDMGNPARNSAGKFDPAFPNGRHTNGSNFIFWDGHVKWTQPGYVSAGETAGKLGCDQDNNNNSVAGCAGEDGASWGNAALTDMMGGTKGFIATFSYR